MPLSAREEATAAAGGGRRRTEEAATAAGERGGRNGEAATAAGEREGRNGEATAGGGEEREGRRAEEAGGEGGTIGEAAATAAGGGILSKNILVESEESVSMMKNLSISVISSPEAAKNVKKTIPYVAGCTYTTGSSTPPCFSTTAVRSSNSHIYSSPAATTISPTSPASAATSSTSSSSCCFLQQTFSSSLSSCETQQEDTDEAAAAAATAATTAAATTAATTAGTAAARAAATPTASTAATVATPTATTAAATPTATTIPTTTIATTGVESVEVAYAREAVLMDSAAIPSGALIARGWDFEEEMSLSSFIDKYISCGFQATQLGRAIMEVKRMQSWRLSDEEVAACDIGSEWEDIKKRKETKCCIWLSFTSNMISSGLRDVFRFLCKYHLVDVIVTSAGGIEEDFVKALAPTIIGDFSLQGKSLREKGWNRIGNLLVPNHNYCLFEDWLQPVLDQMYTEQQNKLLHILNNGMKQQQQHREKQQHYHQQQKQTQQHNKKQYLQQKKETQHLRQQKEKEEKQQQQQEKEEKQQQQQEKEEKQQQEEEEEEEEEEQEDICGMKGCEEKKKSSMSFSDFSSDMCSLLSEGISDAAWSPSEVIHRLGREINNEESVFYWCWRNNIPVFCPGLTDGSLGDNLFFHSYRKKGLIIDIVKDIRRINDIALKCKKSGMIILGGGVPKHHTCNANLMRNGADFAVFMNTGMEYDGSDSGARPDEAVSWGKITTEAKPVKVHGDATVLFPLLVAQTFAKEFHEKKKKNDNHKLSQHTET